MERMTTRTVQFKIYRYDPDKDAKPYMQDISVELDATDRKLLDALVKLKASGRFDVFPPLLPRRRLRFRRHEHQRQERPGLPDRHRSLKQPIVLRPLPGCR
jgi:succinate dehydrogenase / fumarate reductase iron-sulfur subunit